MATNNLLFTGKFNPKPIIQQAANAGKAAGQAFYSGFSRSSLPFRDFKKFEDSIDSAAARVIAFTATTSLIYGLGNSIRRLTTDAIKIEAVMARIGSITGDSADELKRFQGEIFKLANLTSTSFEDAASAAEEFSRQGLKLNETLDATKAALAIAKLSGTGAKAAIEGLTATISTFGAKAGTYTEVANKLLALDAKFATSAGGIIQGLTRVAGVAEQAGLSIDETASAITALKQVTGRSEAVLGNSLKSIFVSLQSEKVIRDLRGIGVEVENSDGSFRDLIPVVRDLSKAFDGLSDSQQSAITQKVAGKYQSNAFTGLLKAFRSGGEFDKALSTSTGSGDNLEKRLDAIFGTTEAGLQRLSNKITEFGGKVGSKLGKPIVDAFSESFTKVLDVGESLFTEGGKGLGDSLVGGVVNVLKGPGALLITAAVFKLLARLSADSATAIQSIIGIGSQKRKNAEIDQFALQVLQSMNAVESQRILNLKSVEQRQQAIALAMEQQITAARALNLSMPGGFNAASLPRVGNPFTGRMSRNQIYSGVKELKNRASGDIPERNAMVREALAIRDGVGGARPSARPKVEYLNLGKGREKVVVNTDEKIVRNYGNGIDAVLNREMMGYARGSVPNLAKADLPYLFDAYRTDSKTKDYDLSPASSSRLKAFKKAGFKLADLSNIEMIAANNVRRGIKPILIDPTLMTSTTSDIVKKGFTIVSPSSPSIGKYKEAALGGLSQSVPLPTDFNYRSPDAINKILQIGKQSFGDYGFFVKSDIGAQGQGVFTPSTLFYNEDGKQRKGLSTVYGKGYTKSGQQQSELFLQKAISNPGSRELRVHALKSASGVKIFGKTAFKANEAFSNKGVPSFFEQVKKGGISKTVSDLLTRKIAEAQVKKAYSSLQGYNQSISGADVLETGNSTIASKTLQLISEKTGLNIGKGGGGVIEYNFTQSQGMGRQGGGSGALARQDVIIGAGKALIESSKSSAKSFIEQGKFIQSLPQGDTQNRVFKSFYKELLGFKKYDESGYLKAVKGLGQAGFGVTAGRGANKRFISYKNLAAGFTKENREIGQLGLAGQAKPMLTTIDNKPAIVNSMETIVRGVSDQVIPNYAKGKRKKKSQPRPVAATPSATIISNEDLKAQERQLKFDKVEEEIVRRKGSISRQSRKFIDQNGLSGFTESTRERIQSRQQRSDRIRGGISGAGFAASFIGGSIAQQNTDDQGRETTTSKRIGGLSNALSVAAISSSLGPLAPIGYLAAGIMALTAATEEGPDKINAYKDKLTSLNTTYKEQEAAIDSYLTNFEQFSSAIRDGSTVAAEAAKKALGASLRGVKDEGLRSKLKGAVTQESIADFAQKSKAQNERELSAAAAVVEAQKLIDKDPKSRFSGKSLLKYENRDDVLKNLVGSVDVSKLSNSDLGTLSNRSKSGYSTGLAEIFKKAAPEGFSQAIENLSGNFKEAEGLMVQVGREILKVVESEKEAVKLLEDAAKEQQKQFDFRAALSGRLAQSDFSEFRRGLKKSSAISSLESEIELLKPSLSEAAQATLDFRLEAIKLTNSLDEEASRAFSSIAELVANEATKNPINGDQYNKISSSVESFQRTRDFGKLIESLKGLAPSAVDSIQKKGIEILQDLRKENEKIAENTKQSALAAKNRIAQIQYNQRASLFGGGAITDDISETLKTIRRGRDEANGRTIYNKYNNPNLPNGQSLFRGNVISTPTAAQRAKAAGQYSGAVTARSRAVIQGLEASKGAGFLGLDLDPNSAAGKVQESLRGQRRARYGEAVAPILKENQTRELLGAFDSTVGSVASEQKRKLGYSPINRVSKDARNDLINGNYSDAINKLKNGRGYLDEAGSKDPEIGAKIDELIKEIQVSAELAKVIPQAAKEAADRFEPKNQLDVFKSALQTLEGQEAESISLLSSIRNILDEQKKGADIATSGAQIKSLEESISSIRGKIEQDNQLREGFYQNPDIKNLSERISGTDPAKDSKTILESLAKNRDNLEQAQLGNYDKKQFNTSLIAQGYFQKEIDRFSPAESYAKQISQLTPRDKLEKEMAGVKSRLGNEMVKYGGMVSPGVFSPITLTNNSLGKFGGNGVLAPPPDVSPSTKGRKFYNPESKAIQDEFEAEAAKTRKEMDAIKAEQKSASDVNLKTESKIDLSFSGFKDIFTSKEVADSISNALMPLVKQYVADYVKTGGKVAYA